MPQRTPLYERHLSLHGKMVDFSGWDLPVQYSSISAEHNAVRGRSGLFDISHMGQVWVAGPGAFDFLQRLVTNDLNRAAPGKGLYAHLLNERGGVIDDLFIYRLTNDRFLVIVNASRRAEDLAWMRRHLPGSGVTLTEATGVAGIALQGPSSPALAKEIDARLPGLARFYGVEIDGGVFAARTGYTGEDGFEFFGPAGAVVAIFDQLIAAGAAPCGLGARDTLRTEVGYPLYGHELDEAHTPFESGLSWVVRMDKGEFVGRPALAAQKSQGLPTKLVGFRVESGGVARPGGEIHVDARHVGSVASGTFSPSLNVAIGTAFLPIALAADGRSLTIRQGARTLSAVVVPMPFLKKPAGAAT